MTPALALGLAASLTIAAAGVRASAPAATGRRQDPVVPPATAQDPAAPPAAPRRLASTGIYTAEQADRGAQTFSNVCEGCHSLSSFTNDKFRKAWTNAPLTELFGLIADTMPDDDPGGLKLNEYADVIAYLLKSNGFASGAQELPSSTEGLKGIVLDFASGTLRGE